MTIHCDVCLRYTTFELLFQHALPSDAITAIVGKSGSGKTSVLRWIAGFDVIENAELKMKEVVYQNSTVFVPPEQRPITYVGQTSRLFPYLTANNNIEFATNRAIETDYIVPNVHELINIFAVAGCLEKNAQLLSSGEKQRVSIVQALMSNPQLLLLDEAFSAIDTDRKNIILQYLSEYCSQRQLAVIIVSHDERELNIVANRIITL